MLFACALVLVFAIPLPYTVQLTPFALVCVCDIEHTRVTRYLLLCYSRELASHLHSLVKLRLIGTVYIKENKEEAESTKKEVKIHAR